MGTPKTWHGVPDTRHKSKLGDIGILLQRKNDNERLDDANEIVAEAKRVTRKQRTPCLSSLQ